MRANRIFPVIADARGMTMVELIFASTTLFAAIMLMLSMFETSISILTYTTARSHATQIANEEVETMRARDYEQVFNEIPSTWPDDTSLDKSYDPPKYKDVDDNGYPALRDIITTTSPNAVTVEKTVERQKMYFKVRSYVLWVDDTSVTQAYRRLIVKVSWEKPTNPGEVVIATNYAKEDSSEPRPSVAIVGVRSTNFNYFSGLTQDTTLGMEASIRGPNAESITPVVLVQAQATSAKATGIARVDFSLYAADGTLATSTTVTTPQDGYYKWPLNTTALPDGMNYLLKAEAVDSLGFNDLATMRVNIDNSNPNVATNLSAVEMAPLRLKLTWDWSPAATETVPAISRFLIERRQSLGGGSWGAWTQRAAISGDKREFIDAGVSGVYRYRIRVVDTAGNRLLGAEKERETVSGSSPDVTPPDAVSSASGSSASWLSADLQWTATTDTAGGSGMSGYYWYGSDNDSNWTIIAQTNDLAGDPLIYQDKGLRAAKTYWYQVYAYDAVGNLSGAGPKISVTTASR